MPYITDSQIQRVEYTGRAGDMGELTYQLQQVLKKYLEDHGQRFGTMGECLGALSAAESDFKERVLQPYETRKRWENGDVWPTHLTTSLPKPLHTHDPTLAPPEAHIKRGEN